MVSSRTSELKNEVRLSTQMADALRESETILQESQRIAQLGSFSYDLGRRYVEKLRNA